jgi:hypothetical protein
MQYSTSTPSLLGEDAQAKDRVATSEPPAKKEIYVTARCNLGKQRKGTTGTSSSRPHRRIALVLIFTAAQVVFIITGKKRQQLCLCYEAVTWSSLLSFVTLIFVYP